MAQIRTGYFEEWVGRALRIGVFIAGALGLSSCAYVPSTYMGLSTSAGPTKAESARLAAARRAWPATRGPCFAADAGLSLDCELMPLGALTLAAYANDRHAQMELGRRFEEGEGVPLDLERAERLYTRAGRTTGGPIWIYVPGVGDNPGGVQRFETPYDYGLPEARVRLARLTERSEIRAVKRAIDGQAAVSEDE